MSDVVKSIDSVNTLPAAEAEMEFLKCCGATNWARQMCDRRPFADVEELLAEADKIWDSLEPQDWLEAFRSHPKIGEQKAAQTQSPEARAWSEQEQAGTRDSAPEILPALADGNRDYESKFGHIFIVCATGKTSAEMLGLLAARLENDPETELRTAAEEQRKITQLRLRKLPATVDTEPEKL